jgi:hypothetical protein
VERSGTFYFFYSANGYDAVNSTNGACLYRVGVARAAHVLGPYAKLETPVLSTDRASALTGPGHCSVVQAGDHYAMVYHAWYTTCLVIRARPTYLISVPPIGRLDKLGWCHLLFHQFQLTNSLRGLNPRHLLGTESDRLCVEARRLHHHGLRSLLSVSALRRAACIIHHTTPHTTPPPYHTTTPPHHHTTTPPRHHTTTPHTTRHTPQPHGLRSLLSDS